MSAAARWSYTATATLWATLGRDDVTGVQSFAAPVAFLSDYSAESVRMTDAAGIEFVSRQTVFTERADVKQGDMVLIGTHLGADPVAAGASEVRLVTRFADTFDRLADDFKVVT